MMSGDQQSGLGQAGGLFAHLEPAFHGLIDSVRTIHRYPVNHVFTLEGEASRHVTCLVEGAVKVSRTGEKGDSQILRLLGPTDVFGLRALLAEEPLSVTITAITPCAAFAVPGDTVRRLLRDSTAFPSAVMKHLAKELRLTEDVMLSLTQRPVRRRIADVILLLHGHAVPGRDWRPLPRVRLKRKDIAQLVGTTPETLSRTLAEFAAKGLIAVDRKRIELIDPRGLTQLDGA
jgi:CRP-like cAMP-binding protein